MKRSSGILLPVTSLPSKYGIGSFSDAAYKFVDWLKEAGQSYWQLLPLGTTGYGNSPYQSFSVYAGNPYMISIEDLINDGVLEKKLCDSFNFGSNAANVDYVSLYENRYKLLRIAFDNDKKDSVGYKNFLSKNSFWLDEFALFSAIKAGQDEKPFFEWDSGLRFRDKNAINRFTETHSKEIEFRKYMQYKFFSQWQRLKKYANEKGIKIIGDIPIYTAHDSADVWANPKLFCLDDNLMPTSVAGCPPDGFSENGQLWGNPLYDWEYHKSTGYEWWTSRLKFALEMYDVVRIDHFRGFDSYYSIPYGDKTAVNGTWKKGPGTELFSALKHIAVPEKIIAEDLGFITDSVKALLRECGYPGMKIIQFAFDSRDNASTNVHLPHLYTTNSVVYTGTHDNQTIESWYNTISEAERENVRDYLCTKSDAEISRKLIALAMRSVADICIIPMQDWLGLDDSARLNTPSTVGGNWQWRLLSVPGYELAAEINSMTALFGRLNVTDRL